MSKPGPFRPCKTSPEIIRLAVMLCVRFPLSLRNVEDLLDEGGVDVSHEMIRFRRMRSLQKFAAVRASVSNHFNQERSLSGRPHFKAKPCRRPRRLARSLC